MMVNFKLSEEMRNDVINMSWAWDKEKKLSFQQELNLWPSVHWSDALSTELQRTHGELGLIQGSCMRCVLHTARISDVETGERVNFNPHWDGELLIHQKDTLLGKKLLVYEIKSLSIPLSVFFLASSLLRLFYNLIFIVTSTLNILCKINYLECFYFSGLFFILPCIDSYQKVDLRTVSFDVPPQEVYR